MNNKDDFNLEEKMQENYSNVHKSSEERRVYRIIEVISLVAAVVLLVCSSDHKWLIALAIICVIVANICHLLWRHDVYSSRRERSSRRNL
ncbi:MAG: hypothetical protein MJ094_01345 [Saccharofermentans sp.]|nr:hypothetical protein [Saccharofermentans sp.]